MYKLLNKNILSRLVENILMVPESNNKYGFKNDLTVQKCNGRNTPKSILQKTKMGKISQEFSTRLL